MARQAVGSCEALARDRAGQLAIYELGCDDLAPDTGAGAVTALANGGVRQMKIVLTATLDSEEHATESEMVAMLRHLGLEHMEGDVDGRRWIQVSGFTGDARLREVVALLDASLGSS